MTEVHSTDKLIEKVVTLRTLGGIKVGSVVFYDWVWVDTHERTVA